MTREKSNPRHEFKEITESQLKRYWRPAMAWQYFGVCLFDFLIGPIAHSSIQVYAHQTVTQWNPLTLQGGGLYHLAMAAIVGTYAYGRTLEKINLANKGIISGGPGGLDIRNTGIAMPYPQIQNPYLMPDPVRPVVATPAQMPGQVPMPTTNTPSVQTVVAPLGGNTTNKI